MSISDPDRTAKKAVETTQTEHTSEPAAERAPLPKVEDTNTRVTAGLPAAERAAAEREILSGLELAATAAERLKDLSPQQAKLDPSASAKRPGSRPTTSATSRQGSATPR